MSDTSKPGWGAAVKGEPSDIAHWEAALKEPFDPWVESHDNKTLLRSAALDQLQSATEARDQAVALIDRLNGAMALYRDAEPLRFNGITQFTPDGKRHQTIFPEGVEATAKVGTLTVALTGPGGQPIPSPSTPSDVQVWAGLAEADDYLDDALIYFGTATEWFDIYKTLETLMLSAGGERAFLALNWAPENEIKRLKQTANSARHAKCRYQPVPNPMELAEAGRLIGQLLRRALLKAGGS
jgi:hypothetical protein